MIRALRRRRLRRKVAQYLAADHQQEKVTWRQYRAVGARTGANVARWLATNSSLPTRYETWLRTQPDEWQPGRG